MTILMLRDSKLLLAGLRNILKYDLTLTSITNNITHLPTNHFKIFVNKTFGSLKLSHFFSNVTIKS